MNEEELVCVVVDGFGSGFFVNEFLLVIKDIVKMYVDEDVESIIECCN